MNRPYRGRYLIFAFSLPYKKEDFVGKPLGIHLGTSRRLLFSFFFLLFFSRLVLPG